MTSSTRTVLATAAFVALAGGSTLSAQESTTRGWALGIHGSGASLSVEGGDRSNAGGGGVYVGYGVNRRFTIYAQADGAEFDEASGEIEGTWTMGHFDLGTRFNFANSLRSYVPFLTAAIGARAVNVQDPVVGALNVSEVTLSGTSLTIGGGIDIYFSEGFALDVQLLWTGGKFTTVSFDNVSVSGFDQEAQSTRFDLGVVWWPS